MAKNFQSKTSNGKSTQGEARPVRSGMTSKPTQGQFRY